MHYLICFLLLNILLPATLSKLQGEIRFLLHMKLKGLIYDDSDNDVQVQVQCSSPITSTV